MNNNDNSTTFEGLPSEVVNSAMTPSQLKVMEVLFLYNGLVKTKADGYFFISNEALMKEAEIGSKTTLTKIIRLFESNGFIERKTGDFTNRKASEYILYEDRIKQWCSNNPKPISRNGKTLQSSDEIREAIKRAVTSAIKPLLDKQREQEEVIKSLQCEIASLRADMRTLIEARCTTDTDTETDVDRKIITNTDSTVIQSQADCVTLINPVKTTNRYDDKLSQLKQAVKKFKETPTRAMKRAVSRIVEDIKSLYQQGGCTVKQLHLAYYIQGQINNIPFEKETSSKGSDVDSSSKNTIQYENANTSVPCPSSEVTLPFNPFQPSKRDDEELLSLIRSRGRFYNQSLCDELLDKLRNYNVVVARKYIDTYLSHACRDDASASIYRDIIYKKLDSLQLEL